MTILTGRILTLLGVLSLGATSPAQEFFREFGSESSYSDGFRNSPSIEVFSGNDDAGVNSLGPAEESDEEDDYNMRLGPLDFIIAAGLSVEFNDNITLASENELSDIIFRPQIDIEGVLRFSESNKLRLGVGIGYAKYLDHDEYDTNGVLIAPNSAIVWTIEAGAFTFTVRERLAYQEDPFEFTTISNTAAFRRWENQAGLQVDWDASQYTQITFGYDRYDLWAEDEVYESYSHSTDTLYFRPSYQVSPAVTVGLNTSYSWVDYTEDIQADGQVLLVGPFIQWKASEYVDVYLEGGYQQSTFDGGTLRGIGPENTPDIDTDDSNSYYVKASITHRPTESFRHKIEVSKTSELGQGSNFYDLVHLEYSIDWKVAENTSLRPTLFYEWFETSGDDAEDGTRFGASIGLYHIFSEHLTLGLDYRYLQKDSNLPGFDYTQNLGLLSLYYKF